MIYFANLFMALILAVACNSGGGGSSSEDFGPTWAVSGTLTYDYVPITASGLNYTGTTQKPVRNVYIEARRATDNRKVGSTYTDDNGAFVLDVPQSVSDYTIGVYSRLKSPAFRVVDNTNRSAIYMAATSQFQNTGDGVTLPNINLQSGWSGTNGGGSYSGTRAAAPFALLDSIYEAALKIKTERPSINFPTLYINWSVNNIAAGNDPASGQIGTSHYNPETGQLYILGKSNADTDEYDKHVVVHEFGHYIEDRLGRSDSIGGSHGVGDLMNMTVAFGEGWGNSLSAMIFDPEITYLDSMSNRQQTIGVSMNMENGTDPNKGWYSEVSVQQILFDIYDSNSDSGDNISLGLGPVMDVMINEQKTTPALTSIFSFVKAMKTRFPAEVTSLDDLVATKDIQPVQDIYGTGETNDGGMPMALPIYNALTMNGSAVATRIAGYAYNYNEAENTRYYRFTATSSRTRVIISSSDGFIILVYGNGTYAEYGDVGNGSTLNRSRDFSTVSGKEYVIVVTTLQDLIYNVSNPINISLAVQRL